LLGVYVIEECMQPVYMLVF